MTTHEFDFLRDNWCHEFENIRDNVQFEDNEGNPVPADTETMDAVATFISKYCGVDIDKKLNLTADYEIGGYSIKNSHQDDKQSVRDFIQELVYSDFCGRAMVNTPHVIYITIRNDDVTLRIFE